MAFVEPISHPKRPYLPPPQAKQIMVSPLEQIMISKPATMKQLSPSQELSQAGEGKPIKDPILRRPRRTNPMIWCGAIVCLIFSFLLILFGIATLVIFVGIKPRTPVFDAPMASLTVIYLGSPGYFNGDFTFVGNFSNPNKKIDVRFEYAEIELYFSNSLIATQALGPFTERAGETRSVSVHMISSLVYLAPTLARELQKQVEGNRIVYTIRGTFRVRASLGMIHYSYWLHGRCQLEMTSPPTGVLITRSCRTKR